MSTQLSGLYWTPVRGSRNFGGGAVPTEGSRDGLGLLADRGLTLQILEVGGDYAWSSKPFAGMLHKLPLLRSLALEELPPRLAKSASNPSFQLEKLELSRKPQIKLLDLLLSASQESLEELHFGGVSSGAVYDFTAFTALCTVHLAEGLSKMSRPHLLHLFQSLGTMPSLETLHFGFDADDIKAVTPRLEDLDFLYLLPPSLCRIEQPTGGLILSSPYILDFLEDDDCLPLLDYFDVSMEYEGSQPYEVRPIWEIRAVDSCAMEREIEMNWR